jgi:hypothetical protein
MDRRANPGLILAVSVMLLVATALPVSAQTAFGEIEGRPGPVSRRQCVGGANAGGLCSSNAGCPGSTCQTTNIFNVSVAVRFNATAAQLTTIRNAFTTASQILLDATDGQAQFGQITIFNNSTGSRGHFWVTMTGGCSTATGTWGASSSGNTTVSMTWLNGGAGASCVAHEFIHQAFDARDEYETGCGAPAGSAQCPDSAQGPNSAGQAACLMECCGRIGNELCWGQAVGDNIGAGNHDATDITEQSRCRSNRSCWAQVGWSWPTTVLVPAGAPDPGTNGVPHAPNVIVEPPADARLVLVLDRSGSMSSDSPTRLARLQTAALDVIGIAENGVQLGLVTFADSASDNVGIAALGANRSAYTNAVGGLVASGATNIGDGLQHGRDQIIGAGGVTPSTAVLLMTDGRNNRPAANPQADLQQKVDLLLSEQIPVFVTCTGDDFGLDSQCAEIANGTNGTYVDSADAAQLPERFVSFYERLRGRLPVSMSTVRVFQGKSEEQTVLIEQGARVLTLAAHWRDAATRATLVARDPAGHTFYGSAMPLGQYLRVDKPEPGLWRVSLTDVSTAAGDGFVIRSYVDNPKIDVPAYVRHKVIQPGQTFHVCAYPIQDTRLIGARIFGTVETPTRRTLPIELRDDGVAATGDEEANDGVYCAVFNDTLERGAYTFRLKTEARGVKQFRDLQRGAPFVELKVADFDRFTEVSATVDDRQMQLDHFKLYRTRSEIGFKERKQSLRDQFGSSETLITMPIALGNPADKNGEGFYDRTGHLQCYTAMDDNPRPAKVAVSNQFGDDQLLYVEAAEAVCLNTAKNKERSTMGLGDFKCYGVKAEGEMKPPSVTLVDQFGKTRVDVLDPAWLCNPLLTEKQPEKREHLTCYRMEDPRARDFMGTVVDTDNAFGRDRLTVLDSWLLCVPSTKELLSQ